MNKNIELVLSGQTSKVLEIINKARKELIIVSPWIKCTGANLIIKNLDKNADLLIYTRVNFIDFVKGVSDIEAFENLFKNYKNLQIKCIPNLHAKIYVADQKTVLLTSGNLTLGGLKNNVEAGVVINDCKIVKDLSEDIKKILDPAFTMDGETFVQILKKVPLERIPYKKNSKKISIKEYQKYDAGLLVLGTRIKINQDLPNNLLEGSVQKSKLQILEPKQIVKKVFNRGEQGEKVKNKMMLKYKELHIIDSNLLEVAIIQPGYLNDYYPDCTISGFNRLKTLGAIVLDLVIYILLFKEYGEVVNLETIKNIFGQKLENTIRSQTAEFFGLNLDKDIIGLSEDKIVRATQIQKSVLSIIAVLFITNGLDSLLNLIIKEFSIPRLNSLKEIYIKNNAKNILLEFSQSFYKITPSYNLMKGKGGGTYFEVMAMIGDKIKEVGSGSTIKNAEYSAALNLLNKEDIKQEVNNWVLQKLKKSLLIIPKNYKLTPDRDYKLRSLINTLNIEIKLIYKLNFALTHPTWFNDNSIKCSLCLNHFVGPGSALWLIYISRILFLNLTMNDDEVDTARGKFDILLIKQFNNLNLEKYVLLSAGSRNLINDPNFKRDAMLSVLYIKYLNDGSDKLFEWLDKNLLEDIKELINSKNISLKSSKENLQIWCEKNKLGSLSYKTLEKSGLDHSTKFITGVYINNSEWAKGEGKSLNNAQQDAAKKALEKMALNFNLKNPLSK